MTEVVDDPVFEKWLIVMKRRISILNDDGTLSDGDKELLKRSAVQPIGLFNQRDVNMKGAKSKAGPSNARDIRKDSSEQKKGNNESVTLSDYTAKSVNEKQDKERLEQHPERDVRDVALQSGMALSNFAEAMRRRYGGLEILGPDKIRIKEKHGNFQEVSQKFREKGFRLEGDFFVYPGGFR